MKFSGLQFLLFGLCTGATAVVIPGPPVCQAPADYCYEVPVLSANACKALISRSGIAYASCTRAPATVVRTETSSPTTTTTRTIQATTTVKTITTTTTIRGPSVSLPPTTLPSTVTSTQTVVSVSSTVTTTTTTTTATTTSFTSTTTTTTAFSDTQTPWTQEYCQVVTKRDLIVVLHEIFKRERWIKVDAYNEFVKHEDIAPEDEEEVKHDFHGAGKRADDSFPTSCSCFLTRTLLNAAPTTTTTTIIKQFTTTTTKIIGGTVPTKTNTLTISKTTSIPGTTIKAQTVYSTTTKTTTTTTWTKTTSTQTSITTFTTGTTSVSTSVSTSTSTRVATQYPCAAGQYGRSTYPGVPSSNKVTPFILTGTTGEESCCLACFKNQYCAFWAMPDDNSQCKLYISSDNSPECTTDQCLGGYPLLRVNQDDDGWNYHPGGCGNKYQVIQTTTEV